MAQEPKPPPLIDYPTHYTFKAMGASGPDLVGKVRGLVEGALGKRLADDACVPRSSSGGKYTSVSVHCHLDDEEQRRKVYEAFHGDKSIVWYV
jgi:putative lipoic acid-binding regulatory protein